MANAQSTAGSRSPALAASMIRCAMMVVMRSERSAIWRAVKALSYAAPALQSHPVEATNEEETCRSPRDSLNNVSEPYHEW